jgi:hypothetical protein
MDREEEERVCFYNGSKEFTRITHCSLLIATVEKVISRRNAEAC